MYNPYYVLQVLSGVSSKGALNVSNFTSSIRSRKPFERPYNNLDDERIEGMYIVIYMVHVYAVM